MLFPLAVVETVANYTFTAYDAIIGASIIILLSYSFDFVSKKTGVPSVILLIGLGIGVAYGLKYMGILWGDSVLPALEILGNIGLILIVLEAALDLELKKGKAGLIIRSFAAALFMLLLTTFFIAYVLILFLDTDMLQALVYAVPISIMSSAIIIPSLGSLVDSKREFMIYEATFSDILGIMLFYFLVEYQPESAFSNVLFEEFGTFVITLIVSILISYALAYFLSKVSKKSNFFTILAMLALFFAGGKLLHLSSLIMILIFGLIINNRGLFFRGIVKRLINEVKFKKIYADFKHSTHESAFLVRTFFFVAFGMIISLSALRDINVLLISTLILLIIYLVRFVHLRALINTSILPELFIAPRGLITVLLFFAIPQKFKLPEFNDGIMFVVIITTSIIMMMALLFAKKEYTVIEDHSLVDDDEALFGYGRDNDE